MFNLLIRDVMERKKAVSAPPQTTVSKAAQMMAKKNVGAVMVVEQERLVGIFTERDALFRVIARNLDPKTTALSEVMTADPHTVEPRQTFGYALMLMQENGFRHAPVTENGKPIGMVSSRNAMDPDLEEFVSESSRREFFRECR